MLVTTTTNTPAVRKALLGAQTQPHHSAGNRAAAARPSTGRSDVTRPGERARSALRRALRD